MYKNSLLPLFIASISILASVIALFTFLFGYSSIAQINIDVNKIPLLKTLLNNSGWINTIIFVVIFDYIGDYFSKREKLNLFSIVRKSKLKLHKEKRVQTIIDEIKHIDIVISRYQFVMGFFAWSLGIIILYNSSFYQNLSIEISSSGIKTYANKTLPKRLEIKGVGVGTVNAFKLLAHYSPLPNNYQSILEHQKDTIIIYLPKKPIFTIDNFYLFILYFMICASVFYKRLEDYSKYLYALKVKTIISRVVVDNKLDILEKSVNNYKFKSTKIQDLSQDLIKSFKKKIA